MSVKTVAARLAELELSAFQVQQRFFQACPGQLEDAQAQYATPPF